MPPQPLTMITPAGSIRMRVRAPGLPPLLPQSVLMCVDRLQACQLRAQRVPLPQAPQADVVLGGQGGIRGKILAFDHGVLPSGVGDRPSPFLLVGHCYS